jgi:hypothetical protein
MNAILIAIVVRFADIPIDIGNRFSAGPDEGALRGNVVQANPKLSGDSLYAGEIVQHPLVFLGVIDGYEVAVQRRSFRL